MTFDPQSIRVTVLSGNAQHASRDKGILLRMNFQEVKAFPSLKTAVEHLKVVRPHLVLVDSCLQDVDGCEAIRQIHLTKDISIKGLVMVTKESNQEMVMDAIAAGCSGFVIRPYSLDTLEKHMRASWQSLSAGEIEQEQLVNANQLLVQGHFDEAIAEFEEMLGEENEAIRYFNMGTDYLVQNQFGKAILAFNKAVALNELYAEAFQGLAYAHKGKGNTEAYQEHLNRAAGLFALQDKLDQLKKVFVEILKDDPNALNPYNTLGVQLRRKGDFQGALHAYNQALHLTPKDENLHYNIAKAYLHAGDKDNAAKHFSNAISLKPNFQEARSALALLQGDGSIRLTGKTSDVSPSSLLLD